MKPGSTDNKRPCALWISLFLLLILIIQSCANRYMRTRDSLDKEIVNLPGNNPFERSLHEVQGGLCRLKLIEYYIMYDLLKGLAENDGINSPRERLLREIQEKHVLGDSIEVMAIFNRGLMDLDENWSEDNQKNHFIEDEIPKRAEQIAAYNCFHPDDFYHFDELGRLIMLFGVFKLESWEYDIKTISFTNGVYYTIGDDKVGRHKILKAAPSQVDLEVQTNYESIIFKMKQEGKVSVNINHEKLGFSNINLHVIPCCYSYGRWNGKCSPGGDSPWLWSRAFIDFYLNIDNIKPRKTNQGQQIEFDIEYEILHNTTMIDGKVAGESLHCRKEFGNLNKHDGLYFRVFTAPFFTGDDTARGDFQLNLKINGGGKKLIGKYPFSVYDKQYELLVIDQKPIRVSGIPPCQRIPTVRPGEVLDILIPVKNLPAAEHKGRYSARVNFYLVDNKDFHEGKVIIDNIKFYKIIDATDSLPPVVIYMENNLSAPKSLIASFDIDENAPDNYLVFSLEIPKNWPDKTIVKRGLYTLTAMVTHDDQFIGAAYIDDLRVK
ncbi:MAG: hypothetical protein JXA92_11035 [candidate division Zixibacteria bacterium]|nr:hypothetical protein [candidate division Zixibacteria bacterium]